LQCGNKCKQDGKQGKWRGKRAEKGAVEEVLHGNPAADARFLLSPSPGGEHSTTAEKVNGSDFVKRRVRKLRAGQKLL
jgi:hypothetical protein